MTPARRAAFAFLCATVAASPGIAMAQEHARPARDGAARVEIPEAMRKEHSAIHEELERATTQRGRVGAAARALAAILHPHFVREEQIALPPLGLLAPLARGDSAAGMRTVLPMTDSLRTELPRMLEEHRAIRAATLALQREARAAKDARVTRLADALALHAQTEEEIFYPAAVLVGDVVRMRMAAPRTP